MEHSEHPSIQDLITLVGIAASSMRTSTPNALERCHAPKSSHLCILIGAEASLLRRVTSCSTVPLSGGKCNTQPNSNSWLTVLAMWGTPEGSIHVSDSMSHDVTVFSAFLRKIIFCLPIRIFLLRWILTKAYTTVHALEASTFSFE